MEEEPIVILVATMSGTAEMVADELAAKLEDDGVAARIVRMEKASAAMLEKRRTYIVCSSTYGVGDVPDNGRAFYEFLTKERPDLSRIRFGVIALGSSNHVASYCGGGKKFDAILGELGARRLVERLEHDDAAGTHPEEVALVWLDKYLAALAQG
jgi:MioC protein